MSNVITIARREFGAYFTNPVGWFVLLVFLVVTGFFFASMVGYYNLQSASSGFNPYGEPPINIDEYLIAPFFANTGVILLFLCPALTMRLFAGDRKNRSLELLLTSPVSTTEIVLGKYLGAMGYVGVLLLSTAHYAGILYWLGEPDTGVLICSYLSILLLSGAFVSVGLLTSAFTESQVVALSVGFGLLLMFWVLSWADASTGTLWGEVLSYASMLSHLEQFAKGLLHTRDLVYYATFIGFFLFATHQRVEAFRWR